MNNNRETHRTDKFALLIIACFSILALLVASWDSYLYDVWQHHDVIWFYMCGKAWMNGMTPYVDFSDSKGPLLWLIYGVGYLLRPHDYIGMYWLSCILYTIIFYTCYKCARLFVDNRNVALSATLLSSLFFLSGLTHIEVRAEDYCYALMLPVFYYFLRHTVSQERSHSFVQQSAMLLGAALGLTLLIKYSCTLMLAIFIPYFCIIVPRRAGYPVWKALGWCALIGVISMLPMLAWLLYKGCLKDFINEYFLITFNTFDNMQGHQITVSGVFSMFLGKRVIVFTLGMIAGMIAYCRVIRRDWLMATIALVWFIGVILLNGTDRIYLNVLSLFTVLFVGLAAKKLSRWTHRWSIVIGFALVSLAFMLVTAEHKSLFFRQLPDREIWYYYPRLMSQLESPKLLYLMCHDHGEGVPVNGLPACKYWSKQEGHTPEMVADQIDCVKNHRCDVAFVQSDNEEMIQLLEDNGYYRYDFADAGLGDKSWQRFIMYTNAPLQEVTPVYPTPRDVLLKRNVVMQDR